MGGIGERGKKGKGIRPILFEHRTIALIPFFHPGRCPVLPFAGAPQAFEQMEECKVDMSSGLVREGQKDVQLATLREQMRQLLAVQTGVCRAPRRDAGGRGSRTPVPLD